MKKLLNTLYVTNPDIYLSRDGENIVARKDDEEVMRLPFLNLEGIVTFGYTGASPALMGACAQKGISLCFMTQSGRFLARVTGEVHGNVLLRKRQHHVSEDETLSLPIAKNMITGKLYNTRWLLERATRDHALRVDRDRLKDASTQIKETLSQIDAVPTCDSLRGLEGSAASRYFSVFNELILQQKEDFAFTTRSRRPPLDTVNAMLSFSYSLLANEVSAALETVGLDPYVGFMHTAKPGRPSLALDLMEELRPVYCDRFVLSIINRRMLVKSDFVKRENGAVILKDAARKSFLNAWQSRKREIITHPFLGEKHMWGLLPHAQAMLLARHLRGDLDAYPPFLWK